MIKRLILLTALLPVAVTVAQAEPFHHPFGEWREYNRDWLAACPDVINEDAADYYGTSCFASTGSQELNGAGLPAYKLTLLRNRLTGDIDISFVFAPDHGEADPSRPLVLNFGGEAPVSLDFASDLETRYNTINQFYVVDPALKQSLLDKFKQRNALVMTVPLQNGDEPSKQVWLSLRGVLASLDFMSAYARKVSQY